MEELEYVNICQFLQSDPNNRSWPTTLLKKNKRNFRQKCSNFLLISGTLHYKHKIHGQLRVIKSSEKDTILHACHSEVSAAHLGVNKTTSKITERYFWPGIYQDIKDFIGSCEDCQKNNHLRKAPAELHPIPPPDGSFKQFGMDLIGPFKETAKGNRYIIVLTDYLTKWPEAAAIPDKKATTIADFLIDVVCRYSSMEVLITDQGREFCNQINEEICRKLGVSHRKTSAYHPQSNGLTERYNQTLVNSLVKYTNEEQNDWDLYIQPALLAYRTAVHKSTKQTPFFLAFGHKPNLLIEQRFPVAQLNVQEDEQTVLDRRVDTASEMVNLHKNAKENIVLAQKDQKKYFDQKRKPPKYVVGDKVFINNPKRVNRKGDKLVRRWCGPYEVLEVGSKGTYRLKGLKSLVNALRLKPYLYRNQTPKEQFDHVTNIHVDSKHTDKDITGQSKNAETVKRKRTPSVKRQPKRQVTIQLPTREKLRMSSVSNECILTNRTGQREKAKGKLETSNVSNEGVLISKEEKVETLVFNCVNRAWQRKCAKAVGCSVKCEIPNSESRQVSVLEPPGDNIKIRGDGNCYFRTVAHVLTGEQTNHGLVRQRVCDYTKTHNTCLSLYSQTNDYAKHSLMDLKGQWATEMEILATASMLSTDVCVYCPYGRDSAGNKVFKWITYRPINGLPPLNGLSPSKQSIYISNMDDHFVPVYTV